ncbi:MAG: bifunctional 23S rRNA (guanine(2069)-N(7))-methyltransferase RlmK/23S rRNA (guanine(2445)-N(2))-methyltransferase RlmL [Sphaerochaeta sp.]|jgi:23S rRNA (guanine2445-N2)-methyltransferase / 23S rRNA (guanine2069-N7)-methyltransferase|nr:bifunctional 23S rRNA (guanine(2069)-N(7))-methyltransferase RlmK/23S rRNA (guanine(2445)-N(2))-methyltransferase RlmL [Sphaerochaeta sp.]
MIFFATSALHMTDIIEEEARQAGASDIHAVSGGVEFNADLRAAYRFCLYSRTSTRLLLGLWQDDDIQSADELYEASMALPWEEWVNPDVTFSITHTVKNCPYLRNSKFGAIRLKDAIVDRCREKFDGNRPEVDIEESDIIFHLHIEEDRVSWFVDFSGRSLHRRGYRDEQTEAVMSEYVASALIYRSEWYKAMVRQERSPVLIDPFCGSGTIVIEAALWAADRAPGLVKARNFAFLFLPIHDQDLYEEVVQAARDREEAAKGRHIAIYGWDHDPQAIAIAKRAAEEAGVDDLIDFRVKEFRQINEDDVPLEAGYIITDPPYGIRLEGNLIDLYRTMSEVWQRYYGGWHITVMSGNPELLEYIDMKSDRTNTLNSGGIACQVAHYRVFTEEQRALLTLRAEEARAVRLAQPLGEEAQTLYNRLAKNLEALKPEMERQGVTNYRIYDRDLGQYNASIDLYEGRWAVLSEYEAPESVSEQFVEVHREEMVDVTERATGVDRERIFVKVRRRQKGVDQYEKLANSDRFFIINENEARYLVNFTDYLDTGIFLDHRPVRALIATLCEGKRFLNLFCYTGTATVQAAKGGAISTVSVDTSSTYLNWAEQNMRLNGYGGMNHFYYQSDVLDFLYQTYERYDVIFCDPPTFSNGTGRDHFDVGRDHAQLIRKCMDHLDWHGTLIFSTNYRRFNLDDWVSERYHVEEISEQTIGDDFKASGNIHSAFLITHRQVVKVAAPKRAKVVRRVSED